MRKRRIALALAVLLVGCKATTRYEMLSIFFDGVPTPLPAPTVTDAASSALSSHAASKQSGYHEHGPYAAKLCNNCHDPGAFNDLVAPRDQLCARCHSLATNKMYIHGPLASGGCVACHDPHSSPYEYLLIAQADTICLHCHDRHSLARNPAHKDVDESSCTACHDAHMSDQKYLLRQP